MASDRAKQFKPFAALKGFYDLIAEQERLPVPKTELTEDMLELLSRKMQQVETGMMIEVTHYSNGSYIKTRGLVSNIDAIYRTLTIVKTKILLDDILDIVLCDEK